MAQTVCVIVSVEDRARLAAVIGDRNRPQKHVARARIVLFSADRLPVLRIGTAVGVGRTTVWHWQQRFAEVGVDGLLCDRTRPPGTLPLPAETVERVVTLTCVHIPTMASGHTERSRPPVPMHCDHFAGRAECGA